MTWEKDQIVSVNYKIHNIQVSSHAKLPTDKQHVTLEVSTYPHNFRWQMYLELFPWDTEKIDGIFRREGQLLVSYNRILED